MYNHNWLHIGNPEIILIFFSVSQILDARYCSFLSFFASYNAGCFVFIIFFEDASSSICKFGNHFTFSVHHCIFEIWQYDKEKSNYEETDSQNRRQNNIQKKLYARISEI